MQNDPHKRHLVAFNRPHYFLDSLGETMTTGTRSGQGPRAEVTVTAAAVYLTEVVQQA